MINNSLSDPFQMRPQHGPWQMGGPTAANCSPCNIQDVCNTQACTRTRVPVSHVSSGTKGGVSLPHKGPLLYEDVTLLSVHQQVGDRESDLHEKSRQVWQSENYSQSVYETLNCIPGGKTWNYIWQKSHLSTCLSVFHTNRQKARFTQLKL